MPRRWGTSAGAREGMSDEWRPRFSGVHDMMPNEAARGNSAINEPHEAEPAFPSMRRWEDMSRRAGQGRRDAAAVGLRGCQPHPDGAEARPGPGIDRVIGRARGGGRRGEHIQHFYGGAPVTTQVRRHPGDPQRRHDGGQRRLTRCAADPVTRVPGPTRHVPAATGQRTPWHGQAVADTSPNSSAPAAQGLAEHGAGRGGRHGRARRRAGRGPQRAARPQGLMWSTAVSSSSPAASRTTARLPSASTRSTLVPAMASQHGDHTRRQRRAFRAHWLTRTPRRHEGHRRPRGGGGTGRCGASKSKMYSDPTAGAREGSRTSRTSPRSAAEMTLSGVMKTASVQVHGATPGPSRGQADSGSRACTG